MNECGLTRWVDRVMLGPVFQFVYWPVERAKGKAWWVKLLALTLGAVWMLPMLFLCFLPLMPLAFAGMAWDSIDD